MKAYLKCLLAGLGYVALFMAMATLLRLVLPPTETEGAINLPLLLCPFLAVLLLIFLRRKKRGDSKSYVKECAERPAATFWRECKWIFSSRTFHIELLAYATFILPFTLVMCIKNGSVIPVVVLLLLLEFALFVVIDTLLWLVIHTMWRKEHLEYTR